MKFTLDWLKNQLKQCPMQMIGTLLMIPSIIIAVIAAWANSNLIAYVGISFLVVVGLIDLKLVRNKEMTITAWYRGLFPKWIDNIIMFSFMILLWALTGPLFSLFILLGFLNNHLNEDRK